MATQTYSDDEEMFTDDDGGNESYVESESDSDDSDLGVCLIQINSI